VRGRRNVVKPFRFGVNVVRGGSRHEWTEKARKVEDLGYSVLGVPDHLTEMLAPVPAVLAAALATTRLRVGTGVINNDFRHPVLLAREAATVDLLSEGRLELGLGAGYAQAEYDQAGLRYDPGATRVARLAETVVLLKRLFSGEPVTFAGEHYRVTGHTLFPLPAQRPRPPILIGGNGPSLLTLAAKEADIVGLTGITFRRGGTLPDISAWKATAVDQRVALVKEAAGDRFTQLELNALVQRVIVTDDRRRVAEELARERWGQLSADDILESPYALIGTVDELVENLEGRRRRWGISYILIHEPYLEALAPVIARLAGT
jgi:probable F420-dependent oxidoreductase